MEFIKALTEGDLAAVRKVPKADLHNHFVLGGSRKYLLEHTGKDIQPIQKPLHSMDEMHAWNAENLGNAFESTEGRKILIRAAFTQAKEDGVAILEIGEDVWGLEAFFHGNVGEFVDAFEAAHQEIAPEMEITETRRVATNRTMMKTVAAAAACQQKHHISAKLHAAAFPPLNLYSAG